MQSSEAGNRLARKGSPGCSRPWVPNLPLEAVRQKHKNRYQRCLATSLDSQNRGLRGYPTLQLLPEELRQQGPERKGGFLRSHSRQWLCQTQISYLLTTASVVSMKLLIAFPVSDKRVQEDPRRPRGPHRTRDRLEREKLKVSLLPQPACPRAQRTMGTERAAPILALHLGTMVTAAF